MTTPNGTPSIKPTARTHWSDNEKIVVAEAFLKNKTVEDFQKEVLAKLPGTTLRTAKAYLTFATKDGIIGQNSALHQDFLRAIRTENAQAILANPPTVQGNPSPTPSSWVDSLDPNPTPPPPSAAKPRTYFSTPASEPTSLVDLAKSQATPTTTSAISAEEIAKELGVPKASASDALMYGWVPYVVMIFGKPHTSREVLEGLKDQMSKGLDFKTACDEVYTALQPPSIPSTPARAVGPSYLWSKDGGKPKEAQPEPTPPTPPAAKATPQPPAEDENHYTGLLKGTLAASPVKGPMDDRISTILRAYADFKEWTGNDVELHVRIVNGRDFEVWLSGMGDQDSTSFFPTEDTKAPSLEASLDKLSERLVAEFELRFKSFSKLMSMTRKP